MAVRSDAVPVAINPRRDRLVGREPLPREALCPLREQDVGSALGLGVPAWAQGLLEQVGGVQSLVGLAQLGEGPAAVEGAVLAVGAQGIARSLDEGAVLGVERAVVFAPSAAKKRSLSASVRPLPPTQIGSLRSRSLTTMRSSCPFRMAIASTPIARGAGNLLLPVDPVEVRNGACGGGAPPGPPPGGASRDSARPHALRRTACNVGSLPASRGALRTRDGTAGRGPETTRTGPRSATRLPRGRGHGRCGYHSTRDTGVYTASSGQLVSAPYHQDSGGAVPEDAEEPGGSHETRQHEEGTE